MQLTRQKREEIHDALLSAHPTIYDLEKMVTFQLDENLSGISETSNLSKAVFDLIRWAESRGRLEELITGAHQFNPGNPDIKALYAEMSQHKTKEVENNKNIVNSEPSSRRKILPLWGIVIATAGLLTTAIVIGADRMAILNQIMPSQVLTPSTPSSLDPTPTSIAIMEEMPPQAKADSMVSFPISEALTTPLTGTVMDTVTDDIIGKSFYFNDETNNRLSIETVQESTFISICHADIGGRLVVTAIVTDSVKGQYSSYDGDGGSQCSEGRIVLVPRITLEKMNTSIEDVPEIKAFQALQQLASSVLNGNDVDSIDINGMTLTIGDILDISKTKYSIEGVGVVDLKLDEKPNPNRYACGVKETGVLIVRGFTTDQERILLEYFPKVLEATREYTYPSECDDGTLFFETIYQLYK